MYTDLILKLQSFHSTPPVIKILHYCASVGVGGAMQGTTLHHSYFKTAQTIINCPPFRSRATLLRRFSSVFHNIPLRLVYEPIAVVIIIIVIVAGIAYTVIPDWPTMRNSRNSMRFDTWSMIRRKSRVKIYSIRQYICDRSVGLRFPPPIRQIFSRHIQVHHE